MNNRRSRPPQFQQLESRVNLSGLSFTLHQGEEFADRIVSVLSVHPMDVGGKEDVLLRISEFPSPEYTIATFQVEQGELILRSQFQMVKHSQGWASADFDADGYIDVAFAGKDGVFWIRNDGNGSYEPTFRVAQGSDTIGVRSFHVAPADYDNDGDVDLAVLDRNYPSDGSHFDLVVYSNDGTGTLGDRRVVGTFEWCDDIKSADLDGDGWVDLFCHAGNAPSDSSPTELFWVRNVGDTFMKNDLSEAFNNSTRWYAIREVFLEDIDSDGRLDLLPTNHWNVMRAVRETDGQIASFDLLIDGLGEFCCSRQEFADLDADGDVDLVERAERYYYSVEGNFMYEEEVTWRENVDGVFQEKQLLAIVPRDRNHARSVHSGDLDGDGDLDILISPNQWLESHVADGAPPIAGDINSDRSVDMTDFLVLAESFGRTSMVSRFHGDLDENGVVDFTDFLMLSQYLIAAGA